MAKKSNLKCQIINIERDPLHKNRMIVSVRLDDGDPAGPWIKAVSLLPPEHAITPDEFINSLISTQDLTRPKGPSDPYQYLKEAQESGQTYTVNLTDNPPPSAQNSDK